MACNRGIGAEKYALRRIKKAVQWAKENSNLVCAECGVTFTRWLHKARSGRGLRVHRGDPCCSKACSSKRAARVQAEQRRAKGAGEVPWTEAEKSYHKSLAGVVPVAAIAANTAY